jgi:thiamine-phosphate pyrophosphorylase
LARSSPRLTRDRVPSLYAIADADVLGLERVPESVASMAVHGIEWIQIRAKRATDAELAGTVERALAGLPDGVVVWIDDRADVAALFRLPGVHVGQQDLPPAAARTVVGERCWIGFSTHDLDQVAAADVDPDVDVVALGPIFPTRHKDAPDPVVGLDALARARGLTAKPLVAIGGIAEENLLAVLAAGADAAVLLGAVCAGDVAANSDRLVALAEQRRARLAGPIYLTGFMGAGKTAVGKRLARLLGLPFVDLDREIENRAGRTIPELFRERGEDGFRALESEELERSSAAAGIVATGGGIVERAPNLATMLRTGRVLWLDVPFDTLLERLARSKDERPLFQNADQARRLYQSRLGAYARCDLTIAVEASWSADHTASIVERLLAGQH